ncbi:helix-turn-helix domain-containing protein [Actinokineospora bangkokensis]|uniref:helix-turn-helix domain-containing protein n=1 Tax=Actinokineospora bangkokensis TaxID=1193682 RepID=UPI00096B2963|nr:helix-turn-helix transcriptional regulator [Actinokineospora bangkokensis]
MSWRGPDGGAKPQLTRLVLGLRRMRERAGLTLQQLSRASGVPTSSLGEAFTGARVPAWRVVEAVVVGCGGDLAAAKSGWRAAVAEQAGITGTGDPQRATTAAGFASELRALLLREADLDSIRAIAKAASRSSSAVHRAFDGTRPPPVSLLKDLLELCGGDGETLDRWLTARGRLLGEPALPQPPGQRPKAAPAERRALKAPIPDPEVAWAPGSHGGGIAVSGPFVPAHIDQKALAADLADLARTTGAGTPHPRIGPVLRLACDLSPALAADEAHSALVVRLGGCARLLREPQPDVLLAALGIDQPATAVPGFGVRLRRVADLIGGDVADAARYVDRAFDNLAAVVRRQHLLGFSETSGGARGAAG